MLIALTFCMLVCAVNSYRPGIAQYQMSHVTTGCCKVNFDCPGRQMCEYNFNFQCTVCQRQTSIYPLYSRGYPVYRYRYYKPHVAYVSIPLAYQYVQHPRWPLGNYGGQSQLSPFDKNVVFNKPYNHRNYQWPEYNDGSGDYDDYNIDG